MATAAPPQVQGHEAGPAPQGAKGARRNGCEPAARPQSHEVGGMAQQERHIGAARPRHHRRLGGVVNRRVHDLK